MNFQKKISVGSCESANAARCFFYSFFYFWSSILLSSFLTRTRYLVGGFTISDHLLLDNKPWSCLHFFYRAQGPACPHCSSIFIECLLLTRVLALSAYLSHFLCSTKKSLRVCTLGETRPHEIKLILIGTRTTYYYQATGDAGYRKNLFEKIPKPPFSVIILSCVSSLKARLWRKPARTFVPRGVFSYHTCDRVFILWIV